jgi:hypothetical protein
MKQFNLKEALAGKPVVTRDGLAVTQITLFETDNIYPLRCVIERCICEFTTAGIFNIDLPDHKYNLFMAHEKKSLWINLYNNEGDLFVTSYKTEVEAKDRGLSTLEFEYIKTIEITNEEL